MIDLSSTQDFPIDSPQFRMAAEDSIHFECLRLAAEGRSVLESAEILGEATIAVEFALSDICRCLNVHTIDEALEVACRVDLP